MYACMYVYIGYVCMFRILSLHMYTLSILLRTNLGFSVCMYMYVCTVCKECLPVIVWVSRFFRCRLGSEHQLILTLRFRNQRRKDILQSVLANGPLQVTHPSLPIHTMVWVKMYCMQCSNKTTISNLPGPRACAPLPRRGPSHQAVRKSPSVVSH